LSGDPVQRTVTGVFRGLTILAGIRVSHPVDHKRYFMIYAAAVITVK
jgi:hypothetical protein